MRITRLVRPRSNSGDLFDLIGDVLLEIASENAAADAAASKRAAAANERAAADAQAKARAEWFRTGFSPSMQRYADGCAPPRHVQ
jgi:hypothetical protein